jgi:hypothetical protein
VKDKWSDVNKMLVGQLEKLSGQYEDKELSPEDLEREVKRSEAMVDVAELVLRGGELMLKASLAHAEFGADYKAPLLLESPKGA